MVMVAANMKNIWSTIRIPVGVMTGLTTNETDIDCGGRCGDAPSDKHASFMPIAQASCVRQVCDEIPACDDGRQNGDESDVIVVARAPGASMTMPACKMPIAAVNYVWPRSVNHSRHAKMASEWFGNSRRLRRSRLCGVPQRFG